MADKITDRDLESRLKTLNLKFDPKVLQFELGYAYGYTYLQRRYADEGGIADVESGTKREVYQYMGGMLASLYYKTEEQKKCKQKSTN